MPSSDAQNDKANLWMAYMQGWKHGASSRAKDPRIATHKNLGLQAAYERGYAQGHELLNVAMHDAAQIYDHEPSPLRVR